jgi:hypothetical protein
MAAQSESLPKHDPSSNKKSCNDVAQDYPDTRKRDNLIFISKPQQLFT